MSSEEGVRTAGRETPVLPEGWREEEGVPRPQKKRGAEVVFADFGKGKVYALASDDGEVFVFNSLKEMIDKLNPSTIVVDSLPNSLQKTTAEIVKAGTTILRLKDLKVLADERRRNGLRKTDQNDVILLRTIYHRHPDLFQPLFTPEELKVRALTEIWLLLKEEKMRLRYLRTITDDEDVREVHLALRRLIEQTAKKIEKEAMRLPLYRMAIEELRLRGPIVAYIVSHDTQALTTLPRDRSVIRYGLVDRPWRGRVLRSRLLILLANSAVLNGHPSYRRIYDYYRHKGLKHWPSVLRVAKRILRDLRRLARQTNGVRCRPDGEKPRGLERSPCYSTPTIYRKNCRWCGGGRVEIPFSFLGSP